MSMVKIENNNFETEVMSDNDFKIMFVGAQWCGHCKAMRPTVEEFVKDNISVKVYFADADESAELVEKLGINSLPTCLVFKDKKEVCRKIGTLSRADLDNLKKEFQ